jgi:hypothetical protein
MYTPIIIATDLSKIIYQEKLDAIVREDNTIIPEAIDTAISEAQSFLSRFDLVKLFGDVALNTSATVTDKFLNTLVRNIAAWHLIKLANVGVDIPLIRSGYEDAIATLKRIERIQQTPKDWPLQDLALVATLPGNPVKIVARKKRSNNF